MLKSQIQKKLSRFNITLTKTHDLLVSFNQNLSEFNKGNKKLVLLAKVYKKWKEKIEYYEKSENF